MGGPVTVGDTGQQVVMIDESRKLRVHISNSQMKQRKSTGSAVNLQTLKPTPKMYFLQQIEMYTSDQTATPTGVACVFASTASSWTDPVVPEQSTEEHAQFSLLCCLYFFAKETHLG